MNFKHSVGERNTNNFKYQTEEEKEMVAEKEQAVIKLVDDAKKLSIQSLMMVQAGATMLLAKEQMDQKEKEQLVQQ